MTQPVKPASFFGKLWSRPAAITNLQASSTETASVSTLAQSEDKRGLGGRAIVAITSFFTILAGVMTFPLLLNFGTAVPTGYDADRYQNIWNFWWTKEALLNFKFPFVTDALYYPYYTGASSYTLGNNLPLYFHTFQFLSNIWTLPFQLIGGVATAYNAVVFVSYVASGVGACLLAYHWVKNIPACLLAGVIFAFSGIRYECLAYSWINIMTTQWLPFYILALHCWKDYHKPRYLVGAILCLSACAYTDWYNTTYLLVYSLFFFIAFAFKLNLWNIIKLTFPIGLGAVVVAAPLLIPSVFNLNNPAFITVYSELDKDYRGSTFLYKLVSPFEAQGAAIWLTLIVCLVAWLMRRKQEPFRIMVYWLTFSFICFVLALGPKLQWERVRGGEPQGSFLPYYIFKFIPAAQIMRGPQRFEIPGSLALSLAIAIGVATIAGVMRRNPATTRRQSLIIPAIITTVISGLALGALIRVNPFPLPLSTLPKEAFLEVLPKNRNDYYILELPITRHNNFDYTRMYTQIYHNRPIMGGYLSRPVFDPYRRPDSPFRYFTEQVYEQDPNKEIFPPEYSLNTLNVLMKLNRFEYVVVYKEVPYYVDSGDFRTPDDITAITSLLEARLGKAAKVQEDARSITYKAPADYLQKLTGSALLLVDGWYGVERNDDGYYRWMRQTATFNLTVEQTGKVKLSFDALAFGGDRTMRVQANGQTIFEGRITPAPAPVSIEFEAKSGTTLISLESVTPAQTAKEVGLGQDNRPLAFLIRNLKVQT